jgi:hypothetical protein
MNPIKVNKTLNKTLNRTQTSIDTVRNRAGRRVWVIQTGRSSLSPKDPKELGIGGWATFS